MLVTRSEDGMTLVGDGGAVHVPAYPVRVRDVSGAGDTVVAVLAAMLALGADFESRHARGQRRRRGGGRQARHRQRLRRRIALAYPAGGDAGAPRRRSCSTGRSSTSISPNGGAQGLRVGFTNGCFDLLHPGHIKLLAGARAACDRLVVGLNGDASVTRLKGAGPAGAAGRGARRGAGRAGGGRSGRGVRRGHAGQTDRRVKPTVLVKGGDYTREEVVGREIVEALGGEVILIDLVPGHSTSAMVERSRASKAR